MVLSRSTVSFQFSVYIFYWYWNLNLLLFSHSVMSNSATPWTTASLRPKDITYCSHGLQASLSLTNFWLLLKLMSLESMIPSNHLIFCWPLLFLPSIFASIRVLSNESALQVAKLWSFSVSISLSNEYSGFISFTTDWLDLLSVQGTLKSLLQHRSLKGLILGHTAIFMFQLSHPYMTADLDICRQSGISAF